MAVTRHPLKILRRIIRSCPMSVRGPGRDSGLDAQVGFGVGRVGFIQDGKMIRNAERERERERERVSR